MSREGIRRLLEAEEDLRVVAEAAHIDETLELAGQLQPDILVIRAEMAHGNREAIFHALSLRIPASRIIVVTDETPESEKWLVQLGVPGILSTRATARELITAIRTVRGGGTYRPSLESVAAPRAQPWRQEELTPREAEVMHLVAAGLSNRDIAERMSVSQRTVQFHLGHIYAKLGASSRTHAVHLARQRGLIE